MGHFLPAFFALAALALLSTSAGLPQGLEEASSFGIQLLIVGAAALPLGLLLSNMSAHITRMFSGEATERQQIEDRLQAPITGWRRGPRLLTRALSWRQDRRITDQGNKRKRWADWVTASEGGVPEGRRNIDQEFPSAPVALLPTRLGNGMRAYTSHADSRYGLDGALVWPRIELLLTAEERALIADAKSEVAFFLN